MKNTKKDSPTRLKYSPLALALLFAYTLPQTAQLAHADDGTATQEVVVTGSRITRTNLEGPSPVTVITAKDIEQKGFKSVYDALNNLPQNTGFTTGEDFGNTFTPAANTLSLRGLGPNHTLVLLDGRRVADYPSAYNGEVNFVNLANIPANLIDRIEILNGGASAVYGSDAIAGVINIILKKQADGVDVSVKAGTTQRGGGSDQRLQISGGDSWGKLSALFGVELSNRDPIMAEQRDLMTSTTNYGGQPWNFLARQNASTGNYIDPGAGVCNKFAPLFNNSGSYNPGGSSNPAAPGGPSCVSGQVLPDYWNIQNKNESENLLARVTYDLDQKTTLYSDFNIGFNYTKSNTTGPSWTSAPGNGGQFFNQTTGQYESWARSFAPEEIGGAGVAGREYRDVAANVAVGVRGDIGNTSWTYDASYSGSIYTSDIEAPHLLNTINNYFLGPQLGTDSGGNPIYAPNLSNFNTPMTPSQFASYLGQTETKNRSWSQTLNASATGNVWDLPAGPLKAATVIEAGSQGFSNNPDPRLGEGIFNNTSSEAGGSGTRSRFAVGAEFNIPITKQVIATIAGRYDDYKFADTSDSKFTYSAGLEYRPTDTLLFRSNYATSFRAPDMNYIFTPLTTGYYPGLADTYLCKKAGIPLGSCTIGGDINYTASGSTTLKPENGQSFGFGAVWAPSASFDASADYWSFNIKDEVMDLQPQGILQDESDCRTGVLDINSTRCQDALARVKRYPSTYALNPNGIEMIYVNPINASSEKTSGYDLSARWKWKVQNFGSFIWSANFTKVLTHTLQEDAGDPTVDVLHQLGNQDWPNKLSTSLNWDYKQFNSTLTVIRYGSVSNAGQTGWLTPFALANFSTHYAINKRASVTLTINNVLNSVRLDTSAGWPNYPVGNFTAYGRQIWLGGSYHFGG